MYFIWIGTQRNGIMGWKLSSRGVMAWVFSLRCWWACSHTAPSSQLSAPDSQSNEQRTRSELVSNYLQINYYSSSALGINFTLHLIINMAQIGEVFTGEVFTVKALKDVTMVKQKELKENHSQARVKTIPLKKCYKTNIILLGNLEKSLTWVKTFWLGFVRTTIMLRTCYEDSFNYQGRETGEN